MRKTGKRLMLGTLHLATLTCSRVQFLFIFGMPSIKKGSESMNSELTTEVSLPNGRKRVRGRDDHNPPDRPRPIGMHPGPPSTEPSSSSGRAPSPAPPPRTVYGGFELEPVKGKPSPQVTMGTGKGPAKGSKGDDSTRPKIPPFFHRCTANR